MEMTCPGLAGTPFITKTGGAPGYLLEMEISLARKDVKIMN